MFFKEDYKKNKSDINSVVKGAYDIKVYKKGELIEHRAEHNLIVNTASELISARMAPGAYVGGGATAITGDFLEAGIQYLAIGHGTLKDDTMIYDEVSNPVDETVWDLQRPPSAELTDTKLAGEYTRVEPTSWCFVDSAGNELSTVTNILKITFNLDEATANIPITELGLYGGNAKPDNNHQGKDTGYLFNHKTFKVINKTSDMNIDIVWTLTF